MRISEYFKDKSLIVLDQTFNSRDQVLSFISERLHNLGYVSDKNKAYALFLERESQSSTGVGDGIGLPHIGDSVVVKNTLVFLRTNSIDWKSIDNKRVNYIFGIVLSVSDRDKTHLSIMTQLSKLLMNESFISSLSKIKTPQEFLSVLNKYESLLENDNQSNKRGVYDVVGVSSCPTGIAHTFMAKERLTQAGKELGVSVKIETHGAEGVSNKLSEHDINSAKGVILAIDREVDKSRFANCTNVLEISTQKAIHNPVDIINKIINKKGTRLKGVSKTTSNSFESDTSMSFDGFGGKMWRSLMTGVSHMLPFIIFGGIMIALGFIVDMIAGAIDGKNLNESSFLKSFGFNYSISGLIFNIGKIGMSLAVPVLCAYIAYSIVGRIALLPGFVIGSIASGQVGGTYSFLEGAIKGSGMTDAKSFLSTGSGFVGGILGAFFVACALIVFSKYIFGKLPTNMQGIKNILFIPLIGTLTMSLVFWILNIGLIFINLGLVLFLRLLEGKTYLVWLLGLILGLMMASDLGGPINKAAYIFGTLSIASATSGSTNGSSSNAAGTVSMAAVMIAGMVPPLGISLSMFVHKKLWTKEDVESGKWSNILFGLSFISEGAIPYTSKNPRILVPANLVGGGVSGLVSGLLGVSIIAPHGGLFVVFLAKSTWISNQGLSIAFGILFFLLSLVAGSIASASTIWFLSKVRSDKTFDVKSGVKVKPKLITLRSSRHQQSKKIQPVNVIV